MKNVLITGTSKGLGLDLASLFLTQGFQVFGVSRSESKIEHQNYQHLTADITSLKYKEDLQRFIELNDIKVIEIIINNAGTGSSGAHIDSVNIEELKNQINLHCIGALTTIQVLSPFLEQSKLVNITSRLGSTKFSERGDFEGREFSYSYRIAKSSQNMLSLCMAGDKHLTGNLILSIIPGLLRTNSGSSDAKYSAKEGAQAVYNKIISVNTSGVYHAFNEEAAY